MQTELTAEERSKDEFFERLAELSEEMVAKHGKDFSMGALETGRAGLVLVEAVAAHPEKKLIAAGYANGRITIAQIGARDELVVRPLGSAVTALAWSGDGRHLAIGAVDGTAAIVTFPAQMFK